MMIKVTNVFILVLALGFTVTGCKKKFGAGCEKAAQLVSPWTELGLPLDEKNTRVCEASADKAKIRSFAWSKKDQAAADFEKAMTAAGYKKDMCNNQACYYEKDGTRIGVQPMDFKVKRKKAVTVVLTKRQSTK